MSLLDNMAAQLDAWAKRNMAGAGRDKPMHESAVVNIGPTGRDGAVSVAAPIPGDSRVSLGLRAGWMSNGDEFRRVLASPEELRAIARMLCRAADTVDGGRTLIVEEHYGKEPVER